MNDTFGNCYEAWDNSSIDYNLGGIQVPQSNSGPTSLATTQAVYFPSGSAEPYEPSDFTWEFLVCPYYNAVSEPDPILVKYTGADYGISMRGGVLATGWYAPGGWYSVGDYFPPSYTVPRFPARIPNHRWTHVAIVASRSLDLSIDTYTFYYNGVEVYDTGTIRWSGNPNSTPLWIPTGDNVGARDRQFLGKLDEVRISDVCRYGDDVPPPPPASREPVKWYKPYDGSDSYTIVLLHFDETTGTVASDSAPAGGSNDGKLKSTNPFDGRSSTEVPKPEFNRSLSFDGTDADSVTIQDTDALDMRYRMSMECGVYPTGMGGGWTRPIISKPYGYGMTWAYDRLLGWVSNGTAVLGYNHNRGYTTTRDRGWMGRWSHIAMTYATNWEGDTANANGILGNRVRLFVDGEEMTYDQIETTQFHYCDLPIYPSAAPIMIGWTAGMYPTFEGYMDELRISSDARNIGGVPLLEINWIRKIGSDAKIEFTSAPHAPYVVQTSTALNPWTEIGGVTGDYGVTYYTDSGAFSGAKKFYRVKDFEPVSMGYVDISNPTITVNAILSDWTDTDIIANRDNFYNLSGVYADPMPYGDFDMYGAYDASNFYFAFDFDEVTTGDVLELMFSDTSFDKCNPNQFVFYVFDTDDSSIHTRWDTGDGDTYTLADFTADGGSFADVRIGGSWILEIKVPYSWLGAGYTFPASSQRTVNFNFETLGARYGTTNPNQAFWPYDAGSYVDPQVGVSRP